jgi:hypothetical protein
MDLNKQMAHVTSPVTAALYGASPIVAMLLGGPTSWMLSPMVLNKMYSRTRIVPITPENTLPTQNRVVH